MRCKGGILGSNLVLLSILFMLGFMAGAVYSSIPMAGYIEIEKPFGLSDAEMSPSDRIKEYNIKAFDDKVVIQLDDPYLARFADTHSMEPLLDEKSTGLEVVPNSAAEISEGDIVSYTSEHTNETIIHRVVEVDYDNNGWYAITKGDNNNNIDPGKIRFWQVRRILVGILY